MFFIYITNLKKSYNFSKVIKYDGLVDTAARSVDSEQDLVFFKEYQGNVNLDSIKIFNNLEEARAYALEQMRKDLLEEGRVECVLKTVEELL